MIRLAQPKWLVVVTAGLFVFGVLDVTASIRTERHAKELPRMTCDDLVRQDRAAPQFVTLTDVKLCEHGHAFKRDMDAAMEMYVPVYSTKLAQEPRPAELVLVLQVLDDRDRASLLADPVPGELTVELWTDVRDLDPWIDNALATFYPGIRLANCRVLSVGLHEPTLLRAERAMRDGIVMSVIAAACQAAWLVWRRAMRSDSAVVEMVKV